MSAKTMQEFHRDPAQPGQFAQPWEQHQQPLMGGAPNGAAAGVGRPGAGPVAVTQSRTYYDDKGARHRSEKPVPVDVYGRLTSAQFHCRKCKTDPWFPLQVAARGMPVCTACGLRMAPVAVQSASRFPWAVLREAVKKPLRPVAVLAAVAAGGAGLQHHVPAVAALGFVAGCVPAGIAAERIARALLGKTATTDGDRAAVAGRARGWGICTALVVLWLAVVAALGEDPHTLGGKIALTVLVAGWVLPAATWWRAQRGLRAQRRPDEVVVEIDEVPMDPDEAQTRKVWQTIVAVKAGTVIATSRTGVDTKATRSGKLVESWIEDWHSVTGGFAFTAVGPDGLYTGDAFVGAQGAIASAFRAKKSMVTVIPDGEDENRALVLVQRTSPIRGVVRWTGPDSIDPKTGIAPIAQYVDGGYALYEVYRPGWGSPHVGVFGTTGSGKSECLSMLFTIDRWASFVNEAGQRQGMVASFLVEPQQGQSFAPFLDDLAAPVASTLDEAKLLVGALSREMLRRNRYLAREAKTWDPRRNIWRKGRKWWNPLVDGPILTLTIDEAHEYLADREFAKLVTSASRMWRKCGGQVRIGTHTPLLTDLGGSMAMRDMLTSGLVFVFRTANSLSGPLAFNGSLAADPRAIPSESPGSCYVLTSSQPKAMLARCMWEPDHYDWVRDLDDNPIGYPAALPPKTLEAFGPEYAAWVEHATDPNAAAPYIPGQPAAAEPETPATCVDLVFSMLGVASVSGENYPMDMAALDQALRGSGNTYSTRTVRGALSELRKTGLVQTDNGRHSLTTEGAQQLAAALTADRIGDPV